MNQNNGLTEREIVVLGKIGEGQGTKEIAYDLGLSPKTVEFHRDGLKQKLSLKTNAEVVRYAVEKGFVRAAAEPGALEVMPRAEVKRLEDIEALLLKALGLAAEGKANMPQVRCVVDLTGAWIALQRLKLEARWSSAGRVATCATGKD